MMSPVERRDRCAWSLWVPRSAAVMGLLVTTVLCVPVSRASSGHTTVPGILESAFHPYNVYSAVPRAGYLVLVGQGDCHFDDLMFYHVTQPIETTVENRRYLLTSIEFRWRQLRTLANEIADRPASGSTYSTQLIIANNKPPYHPVCAVIDPVPAVVHVLCVSVVDMGPTGPVMAMVDTVNTYALDSRREPLSVVRKYFFSLPSGKFLADLTMSRISIGAEAPRYEYVRDVMIPHHRDGARSVRVKDRDTRATYAFVPGECPVPEYLRKIPLLDATPEVTQPMNEGAGLMIRVVDATGRPVQRARLELHSSYRDLLDPNVVRKSMNATTDAEGMCEVALKGTIAYTVNALGYTQQKGNWNTQKDPSTPLTIVLQPASRSRGPRPALIGLSKTSIP